MDFWLRDLYEMLEAIKKREGHLGKVGLEVLPTFDGLVIELSSGYPRKRYRYRPHTATLTKEVKRGENWEVEEC